MVRFPVTAEFEHVDVLIIGAGISGIGMGHYLTTKQPGRTFAIVDGRDAIGGTWDLFRYPGIRSDSDLHTFGYEFKPWRSDNAIADAEEILDYLHEAVEENNLAGRIHLGHKVLRAHFSSEDARWTVTLRCNGDGEQFDVTCNILFSAAGYYDHSGGYTPRFEGTEDFGGLIVHPQQWPQDLDYTGKKVVVIGSGATAVTLIPAMAERAAHVTMLQRSPSYVVPVPRRDPIANTLRRLLPDTVAYRITRRMNTARQSLIYHGSRRYPALVRRLIRSLNTRALPDGYAVDTHFSPTYNPWDQRMCMVPDADLFTAISRGKASVVTDRIARFTERGILLESGAELETDVIVTATGLQLVAFGGVELHVDGRQVDIHDCLAYKGMMLGDVPNFAFAIGYTNASWTLKVDLVCDHLCRMLAHMDRHGYTAVTPVSAPATPRRPLFDMAAGYMQRSVRLFPQQGSDGPWALEHSYAADRARLRNGPVEDPALRFTATHAAAAAPADDEVAIA
ncbi:flavin-containing monooxygenase [Nocardia sp. CA-107356]|uniref:flavin-containing monooxygenase n=1 Tax=Nocardia sp. CA-107356 TaxID=3239972 RepID=UPI003D922CAE